MDIKSSNLRRNISGVTLVELLLSVGLVLGMLGAVVYNFTTLHRGAQLDEGAGQVEALFRFARAQAASTGRQVRIEFTEPAADSADADASRGNVRMTWEPDPAGAPGVFVDVAEAANFIQSINDSVSVREVRFDADASAPSTATPSPLATDQPASLNSTTEEPARAALLPIKFYPDGTGDSVNVVLASRDEEDLRRFAVRMVGVTGAIRRQLVTDTAASEPATSAPATAAAAEALR